MAEMAYYAYVNILIVNVFLKISCVISKYCTIRYCFSMLDDFFRLYLSQK
jgi:hypothetical protein